MDFYCFKYSDLRSIISNNQLYGFKKIFLYDNNVDITKQGEMKKK